MEVLMKFHTRLKQLRIKNKLTQSDLADVLGLKPTAISNYESQRNEPSLEKLIILSEYFEVSCDYLLGITDSYLPVGGEVLDKDIIEIFDMYRQLDQEYIDELKIYLDYLLYKQNQSLKNNLKN
jgi:transcriptional regulator with XRE-family HTH domain